MDEDKKLKIEFTESMISVIIIPFALMLVYIIGVCIFKVDDETMGLRCMGYLLTAYFLALMSLRPLLILEFFEEGFGLIMFALALVIIVSLIEGVIYVILYYLINKKYIVISTNTNKEVGFFKIYIRGILKSISRMYFFVGLIPMMSERSTMTIYDKLLRTDMVLIEEDIEED